MVTLKDFTVKAIQLDIAQYELSYSDFPDKVNLALSDLHDAINHYLHIVYSMTELEHKTIAKAEVTYNE